MRTVLMVAEKPSLAQSLAKILSGDHMKSRKGFNGACSVHEFKGRFPAARGEEVNFKFTSVCGHVMSLDFLSKYNNWDKVDPAELFEATTQKKEATVNLSMPKFLEKEARGVDFLVLWLDCDKEGENICFEVIDAVQHVMNRPRGNEETIYRAHFSAITDTDIKRAFNNLGSPNKNEALSVDARQELDLRIGCAFTRFQTKFFQNKYGDLDSTLISYGPCQTPTLGFCVERHDRIQSFKPEPFWVIQLQVVHPGGKTLSLDWERVRVFDREVAQMFVNMVKSTEEAVVTDVQKKEKAKARPIALNTIEMLRVASSGLGMSPQTTMHIAERLYTQGYISYPRTETTHYPDNFDLKGTLQVQKNSSDWGQEVKKLLAEGIQKPKKGVDAGDHPPITPMRAATEAELGHEAWKLYDYITRHFIATVSADCKYLQTTITFAVGNEVFTCTGKTLISEGFTGVMPWQAITNDENIPACVKGEKCSINEAKMTERHTSPPDYLTESELITLMEKHGIGTDASISVHINNISERNYVQVISGRKLKPTTLGIVLVHGYQKIDGELVHPTMRAAVETQLNLIAQGKINYSAVLQHTIDIFKRKFKYFVENIGGMDELFEVSFSSLADSGRPLSRCGKCRRYMKFVQAKPSRLHCASCDDTYSLPQNGTIKLYKELKCPLDDFELVYWTTGTNGKGFPLCPYCYNNPPFKDTRKGMGCNECTHPTCDHALSHNAVSSCVECDNGVLVLDPLSAPKWRVACNKCNVVINCFNNAQKVSVTGESCEECQSAITEVNFKVEDYMERVAWCLAEGHFHIMEPPSMDHPRKGFPSAPQPMPDGGDVAGCGQGSTYRLTISPYSDQYSASIKGFRWKRKRNVVDKRKNRKRKKAEKHSKSPASMHDSVKTSNREAFVPRQWPQERPHTESQSGITAFFSRQSVFSNHHPAPFVLDGFSYSCSEQFYLCQKALFAKDLPTCAAILNASDPKHMKQLSKRIGKEAVAAWPDVAGDVMLSCLRAKFSQNEHLLKALIDTGHDYLVEASPYDTSWGVGLALTDPSVFQPECWRGTNKMGLLLQQVRWELTYKSFFVPDGNYQPMPLPFTQTHPVDPSAECDLSMDNNYGPTASKRRALNMKDIKKVGSQDDMV